MDTGSTCDHHIIKGSCIKCGLVIDEDFNIHDENVKNCSKVHQSKTSVLDGLKTCPPEVIKKARQNMLRIQGETEEKLETIKKYICASF